MTNVGAPPKRSGKSLGQILGSLACVFAAAVVAWLFLPDWLVRPHVEASPSQYADVSRVDGSNSYREPSCPALKMATAKAMADGKLTKGEAHELREQALAMMEHNELARAKNSALTNVGLKPTYQEYECPYGDELFLITG